MAAPTPVTPALTNSQTRRLLAVMSRADELLASAERALDPARSPFARVRLDVGIEERSRIVRFVDAARHRMAEACDRLGVPRPTPTISARWSIETALDFAAISFAELGPHGMRGYGPVEGALGQELVEIAAALQQLMRQGIEMLHAAYDGSPGASRVDKAPAGAARPIARVSNQLAKEGA